MLRGSGSAHVYELTEQLVVTTARAPGSGRSTSLVTGRQRVPVPAKRRPARGAKADQATAVRRGSPGRAAGGARHTHAHAPDLRSTRTVTAGRTGPLVVALSRGQPGGAAAPKCAACGVTERAAFSACQWVALGPKAQRRRCKSCVTEEKRQARKERQQQKQKAATPPQESVVGAHSPGRVGRGEDCSLSRLLACLKGGRPQTWVFFGAPRLCDLPPLPSTGAPVMVEQCAKCSLELRDRRQRRFLYCCLVPVCTRCLTWVAKPGSCCTLCGGDAPSCQARNHALEARADVDGNASAQYVCVWAP